MSKFSVALLCCFFILTGCCRERYDFAGEIEVRIREIGGQGVVSDPVADTLRGPFLYEARGVYDFIAAEPVVRPSQLLMAMTCEEVYDREVVAESVRLSLDRPFFLQNRTVAAGENLIPILENVDAPYTLVHYRPTGVFCDFDEAFLAAAELPHGEYTFLFEAELEDGTPIEARTVVYLELK